MVSKNTIPGQNPDFLKILEYTIQAPSGHNTQPWKFKLNESNIEIHPNLDKTLPVVDGNHRELYISLGCAAENTCIAACSLGYHYETEILENDTVCFIRISLHKSENSIADPLVRQIMKRQTNRSTYKAIPIPSDILERLKHIQTKLSVSTFLFKNGEPYFDTLANYIYAGNEIFYADNAFKEEVLTWMRFNKRHVLHQKDGLAYNVVGSPSLPNWLGKPIVRRFLTPKSQNKSEKKKINSSSHFVLFTTHDNTPRGWIITGKTLERFWLHCTELGIAVAFSNQPCEAAALASEISKQLPVSNQLPMLLLRIGFAHPMPYSVRKPLKDLILE